MKCRRSFTLVKIKCVSSCVILSALDSQNQQSQPNCRSHTHTQIKRKKTVSSEDYIFFLQIPETCLVGKVFTSWFGRPRFNPRSRHTKDLILPCLTISNISRVKWSNSGKEVAPSPTPRCSSYWKGSFQVALDYGPQLYLLFYLQSDRDEEVRKLLIYFEFYPAQLFSIWALSWCKKVYIYIYIYISKKTRTNEGKNMNVRK